jgi:hypothetical protein
LANEVLQGDLSDFWSEDDIQSRHRAQLIEVLDRRAVEVHVELPFFSVWPDLSVIERLEDGWADRSNLPAIYAAEFKSFPDWRGGAQYRLGQNEFDNLLTTMENQFNRLRERIAANPSTLQGGLVLWRDVFPRQRPRISTEIVQQTIAQRREWVQRFDQPGSRVRFEYLRPYPPESRERIWFDNGFSDLLEVETDGSP